MANQVTDGGFASPFAFALSTLLASFLSMKKAAFKETVASSYQSKHCSWTHWPQVV